MRVTMRTALMAAMVVAMALVAMVAGGCASPKQFAEPTAKFAVATENLAVSAEHFFALANSIEFQFQAVDYLYRGTPIFAASTHKSAFSDEDMEARLETLDTLREFAKALYDATTNSTGGKLIADSNTFRKQLEGYRAVLQKASGSPMSRTALKSVNQQVVADIVAEIGASTLDQRQAEALRTTILRAAPAMKEIASLLNKDVSDIIIPQLRYRKKGMLRSITDYSSNTKSSFAERQQVHAQAIEYHKDYLATEELEPAFEKTMQAYGKALDALVKLAQSSKDPRMMEDYMTSFDILAQRVDRLQALVEILVSPGSSSR